MNRNWSGERSLETLKTGQSRTCLNVHRKSLVETERLQIKEKEGITDSLGHRKVGRDTSLPYFILPKLLRGK